MPLYQWRCEKCRDEKEVVRSFKDYDVPPEEACKCEDGKAEYKKFLSKAPTARFAGYWPGKGNW